MVPESRFIGLVHGGPNARWGDHINLHLVSKQLKTQTFQKVCRIAQLLVHFIGCVVPATRSWLGAAQLAWRWNR